MPSFCLIAASLLISAAPPASPQGNLLPNPGFEQVDEATGYPLRWAPVWGKPTTCAYTLALAHGGVASAMITDAGADQSHGLRSEHVLVTPGRRYQATVYVWVEPSHRPGFALYLEFWDSAHRRVYHRLVATSQPGGWRRLSLTLAAPATAATATVLIYSGSTSIGRGYFDDAALVETGR